MELIGVLKNYEWGKIGESSLVAQLHALNSSDFKIQPETPYAELWLGSHPSGTAKLRATGAELSQNLPFLLKILSVAKALSIQVHPTKEEAVRLHAARPKDYPDANHKPELAIALTPFKAMCGFRPYTEIHEFLNTFAPLKKIVVHNDHDMAGLCQNNPSSLKSCYSKLFSANDSEIKSCIDCIIQNCNHELHRFGLLDLFNQLHKQFPYDVGVLSIFFLNVLDLAPGDAIYLRAKEIHAYISGDCVECMANSDNVIRAGLTPKLKDTEALLSCVNFEGRPKETQFYKPRIIDDCVKLYAPIEDFAVLEVRIPESKSEASIRVPEKSSIMIVVKGERAVNCQGCDEVNAKRGTVVYFPPGSQRNATFTIKGDAKSELLAYIATENIY